MGIAHQQQFRPSAAALPTRLPLFAALAILAAAVAQQAIIGINTDTSWLLTVAERMREGDRLYREIFELNPPASVMLYQPTVALAAVTGSRAELLVTAMTFALVLASLAVSAKVARGIASGPWTLVAALFALVVLPGANFTQREHVAVIALLPWLAVIARRARGCAVHRLPALLVGVGAGVAVAIKPHFGLAAALPLLLLPGRDMLRQVVRPESLAASAILLLYAALVLLAHPDFLAAAVPLVRDGYLLVRKPVGTLIGHPSFVMALVAGSSAWVFARGTPKQTTVAVLLLAATGFAIAMLVQGKGFPNHHYPPLALALIALAASLPHGSLVGRTLLVVIAGVGALMAVQVKTYPRLTEAVAALGIERPSIIVAASNLSIGHPLTRQVGGRWVGTRGALWVTGTAVERRAETNDPAALASLQRQIAEDRDIWIADVRRHRPDLILIDGKRGLDWLTRDPRTAAISQHYRPAGGAEGMVILRRQP